MTTLMEHEARETPQKIALQFSQNEDVITKLCQALHENPPQYAITIGRGSSDHACTYVKYLLETQLGLVTASAAPSVVTVYRANLRLQNALVIGISQSGQSPDLCTMMEVASQSGATTVAIVNQPKSPLAKIAKFVIPMHVGEENAVAATKSYIGALTAVAQLTALLTQNKQLVEALKKLPEILTAALQDHRWQQVIEEFKTIDRTFVIARGFGFPIAQEAALKFKETAGIQAEAFSAAEIMHGPFALVKKGHPFLLFTQPDQTLESILNLSKKIKQLGSKSFLVAQQNIVTATEKDSLASQIIQLPNSLHPILDPIVTIQAFYPMVAQLATIRGYNPDAPDNLKKVTETL